MPAAPPGQEFLRFLAADRAVLKPRDVHLVSTLRHPQDADGPKAWLEKTSRLKAAFAPQPARRG